MKNRYVLEPVTLDKQHFRDPLKEVWKIYDMKNQRYVRSYYDSEESGKEMLNRKLGRVELCGNRIV